MSSMKIKKGDQVVVIAGKYKGSEGKVLTADPARQRVVVEGINMIKKSNKVTHQGPRGAKQGGIVTKEAAIHVSNVMLVDPEDSKRTRAGYRKDDDGAKVRFSRRTGKDI